MLDIICNVTKSFFLSYFDIKNIHRSELNLKKTLFTTNIMTIKILNSKNYDLVMDIHKFNTT